MNNQCTYAGFRENQSATERQLERMRALVRINDDTIQQMSDYMLRARRFLEQEKQQCGREQ